MATFEQESVGITRHRFVLSTPTNLAEVDKMVSAVIHLYQQGSTAFMSDDSITVTVEGDAIVYSWELRS